METAVAYRHCENITRARAGNFFYGIRLLPQDKRRAMCAVYAFARNIDDVGDGSLPVPEKLRLLDVARDGLNDLHPGSDEPVHAALDDACRRFPIAIESLADLIDGVEMDVLGTSYETFDDLVVYCRRVAGSIGRVCLSIFSSSDVTRAPGLADDLGVAMQLTNILRDVQEDFARGRVYLPAEDVQRFGCNGDFMTAEPAALAALIRLEAARDREWFDRGLELVDLLDARSGSCVLAMTGIYRRILDRIERDPDAVLRRRVSLPAWEKALVAAHSLRETATRSAPRFGRVRT
jgi:phytoene synthase